MGGASPRSERGELTLFIAPAPPDLAERCRSSNGFVAILSATAFLDHESEATATLGLLESCPVAHECLRKEVDQPTPMDALLDLGSMLWPAGHRYLADTLWLDALPAQLLAIVREHFLRAPSPKSLAAFVFSTGAEGGAPVLPDAAFLDEGRGRCSSVTRSGSGGQDDAANAARGIARRWGPESVRGGHYVGESDVVAEPTRTERSFAPRELQRLQSLRRTRPDDLFPRALCRTLTAVVFITLTG